MMTVALLTLSLIAGASPDAASPPEPATEPAVEEAIEESSELARLAADEVEGLHVFFHDWFLGALPNTDDAFARLTDALADDFVIVAPGGTVARRDELLERLRTSHGSGAAQGVKIWIRGFEVRRELGDAVVVNYEEWQETGSRRTGRVSTAILQRDADAPGGLAWLHLHETWLPQPTVESLVGDP